MMTCCVSLPFGCLMERLGSGAGCPRQGRATCFCQGPESTGFRLGAMIRLCLSSRDDGAGTGGGRAQQSCVSRGGSLKVTSFSWVTTYSLDFPTPTT